MDDRSSSYYHRSDKKRKQEFGHSDRGDKMHPRDDRHSYSINENPELKYTVEHHDNYISYTPKYSTSLVPTRSKSWADIMDIEDAQRSQQKNRRESRTRPQRHKIPFAEVKSNSSKFTKRYENVKKRAIAKPLETDEKRLATRQRQLDIGKNTEGYRKYVTEVRRRERTKDHPWTPDKFTVCSTRSWSGTMRIWRRKLHFWDPPSLVAKNENSFCNISSSSANDVFNERHIDNSMETDDIASEYSSQASSNNDLQHGGELDDLTEEFLFGNYEIDNDGEFEILNV